ncbi:MAG TPA: Re/Si-specific NAD(P)(+) transhydrogenase subunit alpha [Thermoleophilaceae bacterium]|nr:Re/Si-specific NAD(P)(+) transhydrogenase subunit alpha [Thermoleophilaceae bacterium]
MRVAVPNEAARGERRVALVPDVVKRLAPKGVEVAVEPGAGEAAHIPDALYEEAGARVAADALDGAEVVPFVGPPSAEEIGRVPRGAVLIGFLSPLGNPELRDTLASAGLTSFAMEAVPRITRAQSMDALSSQATVAGYRAGLIAAERLPRFLPMLTTAAGTIRPAKVLVLGAGVAGLQAIATTRRLGAIVQGFDVRAAVKEQVQSLGAQFLELDLGIDAEAEGGYARQLTEEEQQRQRELLADAIEQVDAVITTALVPGKPAPLLVTADAVRRMKEGSVIVDLAAETGGNCELTEPGETVQKEGVTIAGPLDLAAQMPDHASSLYARNIQSFLELILSDEGALAIDWEDEIVKKSCQTRDGEPWTS